jgi:hypothetical protein
MKFLVILFLFQVQICFSQKDSIIPINNFYIEISAGPGVYNSQEGYFNNDKPYADNELTINLFSKFYYKNKRFKTGLSYGFIYMSDYIDPVYSFEANINLFSKNAFPQYFGQSLAYGLF